MKKLPFSWVSKIAVIFFLLQFLLCPRAFAYLDPGSGSYFYQILIALLLALPVPFLAVRKKISEWLRKVFRKKKSGSS